MGYALKIIPEAKSVKPLNITLAPYTSKGVTANVYVENYTFYGISLPEY